MTVNPENQSMKKAADTGKSVHLSASAGSGKTRALKDRYLALLDMLDSRGLTIDQAVAITFTDKAAAEIKERVMHDLPEVMLKKIIRGQQDLRISTIHSFCMNLLKRYPLEAGLPPDFGVLDSRDQAYKIQKAIEDCLEESDRDPVIMQSLTAFTVNDLIATIEFLLSIRSRLKRMEIDAGGQDGLINSIRSGMEMDTNEAELRALIAGAEWRVSFQQMELILRSQGDYWDECMGKEHLRLREAHNPESALKISHSLAPIYFNKDGSPSKRAYITKGKFLGKGRDAYEKSFFTIQTLLYRLSNSYHRLRAGREALSMLRLSLRAEELYQRSKLREGLLDFDDLEIYAYRLLQNTESPDILYWLDRKILHFLVDEFQDTSDIQWAILNKLTEEIFSGQGAEKRMPPTLFVVGDEKQSIYRFREANYRLIDDVRQRMEQNLPQGSREILTLDKNFRSTPQVIETVNQVFSGLWGERFKPSAIERQDHQGSVRLIEIQMGASEETSTVLTEADVLAGEITSLIERGTTVYEKSLDSRQDLTPHEGDRGGNNATIWQARPAAYGDCAILIQSRTKLKEYEAALQAGKVPYRVVGGIGFYEEDEIQAILNVLFFLWNRDDRLSLAAALKSPLFGLSDKDIFALLQTNGTILDALQMHHPETRNLLHAWQQSAGLVPLAKLIHTILIDTGAYIRFGRRNPQAIFNIDKLLDTAREFDRRGYTTLQDFVEWVRNIRHTEQREATADMNLPGLQGSVSILTVHKAKGLEYRVVFLPGMNLSARSFTIGPEALIEEAHGRRRLAIKDADSPVYEDMWKGENGEQEELKREHQRLLYVAMTRARDHLIMIGALGNAKTPIKQNTWLEYLHAAAPKPLCEAPIDDPSGIRIYTYPPSPQPSPARGEGGLHPLPMIKPPSPFFPLPPGERGRGEGSLHVDRGEGAIRGETFAQVLKRNNRDGEKGHPASTRGGCGGLEDGTSEQIDVRCILENIAPLPRSDTPEWKKATDFIKQEEEAAPGTLARSAETTAVSPLTRGSALHRCLENLTIIGTDDLEHVINGFPDIQNLESEEIHLFRNDIESVLQAVTTNKDLSWIFERRPGAYSELPFLYKKDHVLISGIIDRVVVKDGKGFVVDYKSILIDSNEALASWREHYRPQITLYCEAVKEIFKLETVEGHLLFLDSNRLERVV